MILHPTNKHLRNSFILLCFIYSIGQGQVGLRQYNRVENLRAVPREKFAFVVLGDRTGEGPDSWKVFDKAILEINQLRPDFVILIGDIIEGGTTNRTVIDARWDEAKQHLDSLGIPLFMVPGDNDICNEASCSAWKNIFGSTYSAFTYRDCRFILLNTEETHGTGEEGFGSRQMAFVEEELRRNDRARQFFFFFHQPVWISSGRFKSQWERIESILDGKPYSVFAGHFHVLASKIRKGHRHLFVGPTGGKMRLPRNPALGFFHHFTWVSVEGATSHVAFIEPGNIHSEKTAIDAYERYMLGRLLLKGKR